MDAENLIQFLYIDPIKQGLKQTPPDSGVSRQNVFIHRSNKTRIETNRPRDKGRKNKWFLYIDPIKQGLKLGWQ